MRDWKSERQKREWMIEREGERKRETAWNREEEREREWMTDSVRMWKQTSEKSEREKKRKRERMTE